MSHKLPFQILNNQLPDISTPKVFGSLCFSTTLPAHRKKLDSRSRKCIYLGFKFGVKGHLLFDLKNREIFLSRDVIFFEHIFPYKCTIESVTNSPTQSHSDLSDDIFLDIDRYITQSLPSVTIPEHSLLPHNSSTKNMPITSPIYNSSNLTTSIHTPLDIHVAQHHHSPVNTHVDPVSQPNIT
jgi:hypothetical protein